MALTLLEAAKQLRGETVRQSIIELFAQSTDLLRILPFTNIAGNAYRYNLEDTLPGIAFRGVNQGFTESTGVINPQVEALVIAGGDLDVDRFIVQTMGEERRATEEAMKVKSLSHEISHTVIKGDSETDVRQFDGLQKRLTGSQLIAAGSTSGGDVLSLAKLDELIDAVDDPTHLLMSKAMRRRLTAAARNTSVGGFITYSKDEFGRQVTMYNDLPILIADKNGDKHASLAFNEANPGGGTAVGTSIYCLSAGENRLSGIQNGTMDVRDLGEIEEKPVYRTRVEWYCGLLLEHSRAAGRLWGVKDGAVVV